MTGPHFGVPLTRFRFDYRIVRYAMVGAAGIPINNVILAGFLYITGGVYWISLLAAFEISTTINFVLNQRFTYSDQTFLHGWDWPKRALRAQASSITALGISILVALLLHYWLHLDKFLATDIGIMVAFFYNFLISRRIVFRPVED